MLKGLVLFVSVTVLVVFSSIGCSKKPAMCAKLESCCKATSATACPSDYSGFDDSMCQNYMDKVKTEMATARKPLPAQCSP